MNNRPDRRNEISSSKNSNEAREAALKAEYRRKEAIKKRNAARLFIAKAFAVFIFSLIGLTLCLTAIFGYIFIDFRKTEKISEDPVKITDTEGNVTVLDENFYFFKNGEYHVSLTEVCNLMGYTLHGNVKSMTFSPGIGSANFSVGTCNVTAGSSHAVLSSESSFEHEMLFIPTSFFTKLCRGVKCEYDKEGGTKGFNISFDKDFSIEGISVSETPSIPYGDASHVLQKNKPDFICDLSEYEMYMNPENRDEYLVLINVDNKLSSDYIPEDLTDIKDTRGDRAKQKMRLYAAKSLEALFMEMRAAGFSDVSVTSGYRSYDYQTLLFNNEVASLRPTYGDRAEAQAATAVAIPGSSEHQSGLCIDMHNLAYASTAFASQQAYRWLYANCADFGFILRYPKDKTDLTGIMFEPWHYRYVGRYHAKKIMDGGYCLEEYMDSLR